MVKPVQQFVLQIFKGMRVVQEPGAALVVSADGLNYCTYLSSAAHDQ